MSYFLAGLKSYFIVHVQWIWTLITCLSTTGDGFSIFQTWNKRALKRKFTAIRSFTLLILVLSKKTLIFFCQNKTRAWQMAKTWHTWGHDTVQSLAVVPLRIVHDNCGFTERSLVYWGLYIFFSFNAHQCQYFTFVLKCFLPVSTTAYIHPHYRLFLIIWNQTLILKEQLKSHSKMS